MRRSRRAFGRGGKIFSLGLLLMYVIAAMAALYFVLHNFNGNVAKMGPGVAIGDYQGAMLGAYERADQKVFYTITAARASLAAAIKELYADTRAFFSQVNGDSEIGLECGSYVYQLWNEPRKECLVGQGEVVVRQKILEALKPKTLGLLAQKTREYPGGGFSAAYDLSAASVDSGAKFSAHFSGPQQEEPFFLGAAPGTPATTVERQLEGNAPVEGGQSTPGLVWPILGGGQTITSCYGPRVNPVDGKEKPHRGIDLRDTGDVVAVADGTVLTIGDVSPTMNFGKLVWIRHAGNVGISTRYLHLDAASIKVKIGDTVRAGQVIGTPAKNLDKMSPHLHFEVLMQNPPSKGQAFEVTSQGTWYALNPACFYPKKMIMGISVKPGDNACQRSPDQPRLSCDDYGLTLQEPQAFTPGTAIERRQEGETAPMTTQQPVVGSEPGRPSNAGLNGAQQAQFQRTEENRYTYGWDKYVVEASQRYGVEQPLILGVITQESLGEPTAISPTGCAGIMQICYGTATGLPGLSSLVKCDCSRQGSSCRCTPENDDRLRPEKAIPAGAALLRENLDAFSTYTHRVEFAVAAYNVGGSVVRKAINGVGGDPSWDGVVNYLKGHPELISYFSSRAQQEAKVAEVTKYVENVVAFAAAWNGNKPLDPGHEDAVNVVRAKYGEITRLGSFTYDPGFVVELPDTVTPFVTLALWADSSLARCAAAEQPGECLIAEAQKANPPVRTACEDDQVVQYFSNLYQALRDCSENKQAHCQCALPTPPASATVRYQFTLDALRRTALLNKEGVSVRDVTFTGISAKTLRVTPGSGMGVVPETFTITLTPGEASATKFSLEYKENGASEIVSFAPGWVVEKGDDTEHLIFREESSDVLLCAPVKTRYAFCSDILKGMPTVKFALTLKDEKKPGLVTNLVYDPATKFVTFNPSSKDVSFYNVYDGGILVLQLRSAQFDGSCFASKTIEIAAVDKAGNEGEKARISLPATPSTSCHLSAITATPAEELPVSEIPVSASKVQETGSTSEKKQEKIAVIGNSHIVSLKKYLAQKGATDLVLEDSDASTSDEQGCVNCDLLSAVGRNLIDMRERLPQTMADLQAQGVTGVIIFEGTNSLGFAPITVKTELEGMVSQLRSAGFKVYIAEMPLGVAGSAPSLTPENIATYNAMIAGVGADGVVEDKDVPWIAGQLNGYDLAASPNTFVYLYEKFIAIG